MGIKKKVGKNRLDKFYHLAKEQGFRSRASFKLVQLNKKFGFLHKAKCVIDLCAAPGSWTQVCQKYMPSDSLIVAVDLVPMKPMKNVITLVEDITTEKCRTAIRKEIKHFKCEVVLNDGAPNVGGAWSKDAYGQSELVLFALKVATQHLAPNGWFVTKIFRSADYTALLWVFNQLFRKVEATKPAASRNESAEIFVVCSGYLAPAKIDAKLLDPRHVFKEPEALEKKRMDIFHQKDTQRKRGGYEDGVTLLYKTIPVAEFIAAADPVPLLSEYNAVEFGGDDDLVTSAKETTPDILACLKDLRVLGKADFKRVLRWRASMRKHQKERAKELEGPSSSEGEDGEEEEEEEDEDQKLDRELDEVKSKADRLKKREKKLAREKLSKYRTRVELKMALPDDEMDAPVDDQLFRLDTVKKRNTLTKLHKRANQLHDYDEADEEGGLGGLAGGSDGDEDDSDEDGDGYTQRVDDEMEEMYDQYMERTGKKSRRLKKGKNEKKKLAKLAEEEEMEALKGQVERGIHAGKKRKPATDGEELLWEDHSDEGIEDEGGFYDEAADQGRENPLLVSLKAKKAAPTSDAVANRWFSQDLFEGIADQSEEDDDVDEIQQLAQDFRAGKKAGKLQRRADRAAAGSESDSEDGRKKKGDFEVVEKSDSDSDSYSDDSVARAELMAMGSVMVRGIRKKEELIDDSFHRYAFNDHDVPKWFEDDENKHLKIQKPVTRELVNEMKAKLMAINARPIQKIAEARARKKRRVIKKTETFKRKASKIVEEEDMNNKTKSQAIQKLYAASKRAPKQETKYVVAKKFQRGKRAGGHGGGKTKGVDGRMKSDTRGKMLADKRAGKKVSHNSGKGRKPKKG